MTLEEATCIKSKADTAIIPGTFELLDNTLSSCPDHLSRYDFSVLKNVKTDFCQKFDCDVSKWISDHSSFLKEFLSFSEKTEHALGIAANQLVFKGRVKLNFRFFSFREQREEASSMIIVIDPTIDETYGDLVDETEGCLTWPGKNILARRYLKIKVSYFDVEGNRVEGRILDRYQSQVFQHEMDHLNGLEEVQKVAQPYQRTAEKVGRNDLCPCGSGLKFKKCCNK